MYFLVSRKKNHTPLVNIQFSYCLQRQFLSLSLAKPEGSLETNSTVLLGIIFPEDVTYDMYLAVIGKSWVALFPLEEKWQMGTAC